MRTASLSRWPVAPGATACRVAPVRIWPESSRARARSDGVVALADAVALVGLAVDAEEVGVFEVDEVEQVEDGLLVGLEAVLAAVGLEESGAQDGVEVVGWSSHSVMLRASIWAKRVLL